MPKATTRVASFGGAALILLVALPIVAPTASAETTLWTNKQIAGWEFDVFFSTVTGAVLKDVTFDGEYYLKHLSVPWINVDGDSGVIKVGAADGTATASGNSGSASGYIVFDLNSGNAAGDNDGYDQQFYIYFYFYDTGALEVDIMTSDGEGYQEHPVYWDVAPCHDCGSVDSGDDGLMIDASTGGGTTNLARQDKETEISEQVYRNRIYKVFDEVCPSSCWFEHEFDFQARDYFSAGDDYLTKMWVLQCTACTADTDGEYENVPTTYQGSDSTWDADIILVQYQVRQVSWDGFTSQVILASAA